jgi:hypothetical protein
VGITTCAGTLPLILPAVLRSAVLPDNWGPQNRLFAVSGEAGAGKTLSSLVAACRAGDTFYAIGRELNFEALETELAAQTDEDPVQVGYHLVRMMRSPAFNWEPHLTTSRTICLVIDEVGPYPLCARALCGEHGSLRVALFLESYFKTPYLKLFVVGTTVNHNFSFPRNPGTKIHVRTAAFTDLQELYTRHSVLWRAIVKHVDPEELKGGVFARLWRLSQNPRAAAILLTLSTADIGRLVNTATCRGARELLLRKYAASVVWALISTYGGLGGLDAARAATDFGAAFAVAWSNEKQES